MIVLYILIGILVGYILFLTICALAVNPKKEYSKHSRFYRRLLNGATAIAMRICRIKIHVSGMEKIPEEGRLLFVGNHRSNFDPIITWHVLKKWDVAFISKPENFKLPVFGRLIRKCCFLAIDRQNPRNAIKTVQQAAKLLTSDQVSIGVYPEGTRSTDTNLLPFHNGVFKIAQKANVPIVVLAIRGSEKIHKNYPWHRSHVYLDVVDVIPPEELSGSTALIGQRVMDSLLTKIYNEV